MLDSRNGRAQRKSAASSRHAKDETLGLYILGDLSLQSTLVTEEHLSSCTRCKNQLEQVAAVVAALRG